MEKLDKLNDQLDEKEYKAEKEAKWKEFDHVTGERMNRE